MDLNVQAFRLVQQAVADEQAVKRKRDATKRAGINGGLARASKLSSERRTEIAKQANEARWKKTKAA